ncbi:MAG TPA: hypothetical protein VEO02_14740, partial [Thermoanaerobaculia bacterium]|nr:hypothetical protein [Thermoanaerobaculia bacterium]
KPVAGRVVAVLSDVRIASRVSGDVVVWGGTVTFSPSGFVEGNLSVFGGGVNGPEGKPLPVGGMVSTPGTFLRLYLDEVHRAPWQERSQGLLFRGLRLLALSVWLAVSLALLFCFASPFARAAASADTHWSSALLAGALGVLSLLLATVAALALLPPALSIPIAILLGLVAVAAKIFGMGALFLLLGQKLVGSVAPAKRPAALAAGLALLGAVSLLPFIGSVVWSAASVVAVGIAFLTRFGIPRYRVAIPA